MDATPRRTPTSPALHVRALGAGVAFLALPLTALSAGTPDWTDRWQSASTSSRLAVHSAVPLPSGGFVLQGSKRTFWYAADGTFLRTGSPPPAFGTLVGNAPGLLEFREPWSPFMQDDADCDFARLDDGTVARQYGALLRHGASDLGPESRYSPGPGGVHYVWELHSNSIFRVSLDCHLTPVPFDDGTILGLVNVAGSADALVLSTPPDDPLAPVRLQRLHPDGAVAWTRELPAGAGHPIAADAAGGVLVGGRPPADPGLFTAMRIDGEGMLVWSGQVRAEGRARAIEAAPGGGATLWLQPEWGTPHIGTGAAVQFDADGSVLAQTDLSPLWPSSPVASTAATPSPWRLTFAPPRSPIVGSVVRARPDGVDTLVEPGEDDMVLAQTHDGQLLLREGEPLDPDAHVRLFDPVSGSSRRLDVPGQPVRTHAAAVAADLEGVAWVAADQSGSTRLRMLDDDGSLRWQRELTPSEIGSEESALHPQWRLELGDDELCATRRRNETEARADVVCVARADGAVTVPLQQVADGAEWPPMLLRAGLDRTLLYSRRSCLSPAECHANLLRRRIAGDGSLGAPQAVVETSLASNAHFSAPDSLGTHGAALSRRGLAPEGDAVLRVDGSGQLAWLQRVTAIEYLPQVHGTPDGRILRVTQRINSSQRFVGEHGLDGSLRWTRPIDLVDELVVAAAPGAWLLAGRGDSAAQARHALLHLSSDGGTETWRIEQRASYGPIHADAIVVPGGADAVAWMRYAGPSAGAGVEWRALEDGTLLGADAIPAPATVSGGSAAGPDAALLLASTDAALLYRFAPPADPQAITDSLLGSWYEPATAGQGLFLGALPDTRSVYGGWFTYIPGGSNDRAHQRWYTLAGTVREDGGMDLTIFEARGGRFAQAPSVDSVPVGTATMRMENCGAVQLNYAFEPPHNDGAEGTLLLQRTSAAACEGPPVTAAGIRGGPFFDPDASGQGVFLEPLRTGNQTRLAALWFTFDPADAADDPSAQHWFTMLSDPIESGDRTASLAIMRTIGGGFDASATDNTHRVGTAQLRIDSCASVHLDYTMDESDLAGAYAGLDGTVALQRIGACTD